MIVYSVRNLVPFGGEVYFGFSMSPLFSIINKYDVFSTFTLLHDKFLLAAES